MISPLRKSPCGEERWLGRVGTRQRPLNSGKRGQKLKKPKERSDSVGQKQVRGGGEEGEVGHQPCGQKRKARHGERTRIKVLKTTRERAKKKKKKKPKKKKPKKKKTKTRQQKKTQKNKKRKHKKH